MYKYTAPPPLGQFARDVGYSSSTLLNVLQHCLYFSWGVLCPLICYTAEGVSRNNDHWIGCAVIRELHPVLAL